jgi:hypothetical protein
MFRAGDIVLHRPSGERWMLACDEYQGEVVCCGWPETFAKASDCELRHAANDADRRTVLADVSRHHDTIRGRRAYSQLAATYAERGASSDNNPRQAVPGHREEQ